MFKYCAERQAGGWGTPTTPLGHGLHSGVGPRPPLLALAAVFSDVQGVRAGGGLGTEIWAGGRRGRPPDTHTHTNAGVLRPPLLLCASPPTQPWLSLAPEPPTSDAGITNCSSASLFGTPPPRPPLQVPGLCSLNPWWPACCPSPRPSATSPSPLAPSIWCVMPVPPSPPLRLAPSPPSHHPFGSAPPSTSDPLPPGDGQ